MGQLLDVIHRPVLVLREFVLKEHLLLVGHSTSTQQFLSLSLRLGSTLRKTERQMMLTAVQRELLCALASRILGYLVVLEHLQVDTGACLSVGLHQLSWQGSAELQQRICLCSNTDVTLAGRLVTIAALLRYRIT